MLSKKIRERFYKEEVFFFLFRLILSNIDIFTTSRRAHASTVRRIILWLSCVPQVCSKTVNLEPFWSAGVMILKMEFVSQATVLKEVLPAT
jgi:hypothetical protein